MTQLFSEHETPVSYINGMHSYVRTELNEITNSHIIVQFEKECSYWRQVLKCTRIQRQFINLSRIPG